MVNIAQKSRGCGDITRARVCEVIVGILCGGMMMMILPSTSDGALLTALKNVHARLLERTIPAGGGLPTLSLTRMRGVIGQITDNTREGLLRIQAL